MSDNSKLSKIYYNLLIFDRKHLTNNKKIGSGGFGKVLSCDFFNLPMAVKVMKNFKDDLFRKEIKIIRKLKHPNIPLLYGLTTKESKYSLGIASELIEGEDFDVYIRDYNPKQIQLLIHLIEFTTVLLYCHNFNLIHRDLKPSNIMLDQKLNLKLLDFGISKMSERSITETKMIGTVTYMAPENFSVVNLNDNEETNTSSISKKVDIWAVGCIIMEVFSGEKPWNIFGSDNHKIIAMLSKGKDLIISNKITDFKIKLLISECTKANPSQRPNIETVRLKLLDILWGKLRNPLFDLSEELGDIDSSSRYYLLKKVENLLQEFLKKFPETHQVATTGLQLILKESNYDSKRKKEIKSIIKSNYARIIKSSNNLIRNTSAKFKHLNSLKTEEEEKEEEEEDENESDSESSEDDEILMQSSRLGKISQRSSRTSNDLNKVKETDSSKNTNTSTDNDVLKAFGLF